MAEIKKVLKTKKGVKFVIVPKKSKIEAGEYVSISKINKEPEVNRSKLSSGSMPFSTNG